MYYRKIIIFVSMTLINKTTRNRKHVSDLTMRLGANWLLQNFNDQNVLVPMIEAF